MCIRDSLRERGVAFNEDTKFGVMLSVPAACPVSYTHLAAVGGSKLPADSKCVVGGAVVQQKNLKLRGALGCDALHTAGDEARRVIGGRCV